LKLANPGPLGLAAFGLTTILLSCKNAGLLPADATSIIVPLAFAYGGLAQLIAGIMEFRTGNTFGMVAFTSYGAFWWWWAFLNWSFGAKILAPPASAGSTVALTLLVWGIFTFLLWIVTFRANKGVWSIFLLLWITFVLLALGEVGSPAMGKLGGWVGLLTGIDALLVGFVEVLNSVAGRAVVSLGSPIISD
jgi:succinate-acetate transporter protein